MPDINLAPYDARQQAINRKRAMLEALQQQGMAPIQQVSPGAPIAATQGLSKLADALFAAIGNKRLDKKQTQLSAELAGYGQKQDATRMAQALGIANQATPQPQGEMLPPAGGPLGPQGPGPQLPPAPQQISERRDSVTALAQALSSQDPMMRESGGAMLQALLVGSREDKKQAEAAARQAAETKAQYQQAQDTQAVNQRFVREQAEKQDAAQKAQYQAEIASREKIADMKPDPNKPQPTSAIQEYSFYSQQETAAGRKPLSFADWQKRDANLKNPPQKDESGSYNMVTDTQGRIIGAVNPKTNTFKTPEQMGMPADAQKNATSPERQKMQANAQSGLRAIQDFKAEIAKPGVLAALAVPGSPTARKARAARNEMIDVLTRLRTGAALNKDEQAFYTSQAPGLIDALLNDPDTIGYKLSIFEKEFQALAGEAPKGAAGAPVRRYNPATGRIE